MWPRRRRRIFSRRAGHEDSVRSRGHRFASRTDACDCGADDTLHSRRPQASGAGGAQMTCLHISVELFSVCGLPDWCLGVRPNG